MSSWCLNQQSRKIWWYLSKSFIFPKCRKENQNSLKPPPRCRFSFGKKKHGFSHDLQCYKKGISPGLCFDSKQNHMHHKVQKLQKSMTGMKHGKACYWGSKQKRNCHCFETKVMLRPDIHRKTLFFDRSTLRQPRHFASYTSCAEESWHTHVQCQGNRCTGWKSNTLPANKASVRFLLLYQSQQDTFLAFENQSPWHTPQFKTIWMFFFHPSNICKSKFGSL